MFFGCSSLVNINLSNFNTKNFINMTGMFAGCNSLLNIDLSTFNTQNVKDMSFLFSECKFLINLNYDCNNYCFSSHFPFWLGYNFQFRFI